MKQVQVYETRDGVRHESIQAAKRHLENLFANKVSYVANNMPLGRGVGLAEWIVENLDVFLVMDGIQQDMKMLDDEE